MRKCARIAKWGSDSRLGVTSTDLTATAAPASAGGGIAMWEGGLKILGQKKICSSFLALTASRERFDILDKRNKLFGYLYNIADLSRASDDDLQTKCEALESALTANYCDGILKDNNG